MLHGNLYLLVGLGFLQSDSITREASKPSWPVHLRGHFLQFFTGGSGRPFVKNAFYPVIYM
jgi:hypothetical protein